jgi:hypothetical protein
MDIVQQIKALYPEIGLHQIRVRAVYDESQENWQVRFSKDKYAMTTLLEKPDMALMLSGKPCLSLTVEIRQMMDSLLILKLIPSRL